MYNNYNNKYKNINEICIWPTITDYRMCTEAGRGDIENKIKFKLLNKYHWSCVI